MAAIARHALIAIYEATLQGLFYLLFIAVTCAVAIISVNIF